MNNLKLPITNRIEMEVFIEFPISILASYKGISNLDETWDDNIMYIVNNSLLERGCIITHSAIQILGETQDYEEKLVYRLGIIANPPSLNLSTIVDNLKKEKFENGLCIKLKKDGSSSTTLYSDVFCADRM